LLALGQCLHERPDKLEDDAAFLERLVATLGDVGAQLVAAEIKDDVLDARNWQNHSKTESWFRSFLSHAFDPELNADTLRNWLGQSISGGDRPATRTSFFNQIVEAFRGFSDRVIDATGQQDTQGDDAELVQTLLGICYFDAVSLYHLAESPTKNAEIARTLYAGRPGDERVSERGLAANCLTLRSLNTLPWQDLSLWQFLDQAVSIISRAAPERRGWRVAWEEIAGNFRGLNPIDNSEAAWNLLRERLALLCGQAQKREKSSVLAYRDEAGRVFDFHSLRHQYISNLAAAGVHPKIAQTLARHSPSR
jgi:hypothetical protein